MLWNCYSECFRHKVIKAEIRFSFVYEKFHNFNNSVLIQSPVAIGRPGYSYNGYGYNGGYNGYGGNGEGGCDPCETNGFSNYPNGYGK